MEDRCQLVGKKADSKKKKGEQESKSTHRI